MHLDVRYPIGLMFAVFGLILSIYGGVAGVAANQRVSTININLWWGLVLLAFGLVMLLSARRAAKKQKP
jgi:uncharacterized membrane protein YfcA